MRTVEEIKKILAGFEEKVKKEYRAEIIGLFGSYAKRSQQENSDIDILVNFYRGASLLDLTGLAGFLEEKIGIPVDIVPVDTVKAELKKEIMKEAIYL